MNRLQWAPSRLKERLPSWQALETVSILWLKLYVIIPLNSFHCYLILCTVNVLYRKNPCYYFAFKFFCRSKTRMIAGIGRFVTLELVKRGCHVFAVDILPESLVELKSLVVCSEFWATLLELCTLIREFKMMHKLLKTFEPNSRRFFEINLSRT